MSKSIPYPIGTPGVKWQDAEKQQWLQQQRIKRSYETDVVQQLTNIGDNFIIETYGALSCNSDRYPLFFVKPKNINSNKPNILITGGVHGYETSGVLGALKFLISHADNYSASFNIFSAPCISPWAYETINRWNSDAKDPNRSFYQGTTVEEAALLMQHLQQLHLSFLMHIDLHETTETDNSEFRPALAARDAIHQEVWDIPDGFYLVGDCANQQPEFQKAIIANVKKVTHIAPADANGNIIGDIMAQPGVINYDVHKLHLCISVTDAKYVTTTEVYPDSPLVDNENCIAAQVAAIIGGLDFLITRVRSFL